MEKWILVIKEVKVLSSLWTLKRKDRLIVGAIGGGLSWRVPCVSSRSSKEKQGDIF